MPVVELVGLRPFGKLVDSHALRALFRKRLHEQAKATRGGKRVNDMDLALGKLVRERLGGDAGRLDRARNARGERDVQDVLSLLEKRAGRTSHTRPVPMAAVLVSAPSFIA